MGDYAKAREAASRKGATEEIGVTYRPWEKEGQELVGVYVTANEVPGQFQGQFYNQYLFETDDGMVKFHLGAAADRDLGPLFVPGEIYYIRYDGEQPIGGGKRVNRFHVEHVPKEFLAKPAEQKAE